MTLAGHGAEPRHISMKDLRIEVSHAQCQGTDRAGANVRRAGRAGCRPDYATALPGNGRALSLALGRASGNDAFAGRRARALIPNAAAAVAGPLETSARAARSLPTPPSASSPPSSPRRPCLLPAGPAAPA